MIGHINNMSITLFGVVVRHNIVRYSKITDNLHDTPNILAPRCVSQFTGTSIWVHPKMVCLKTGYTPKKHQFNEGKWSMEWGCSPTLSDKLPISDTKIYPPSSSCNVNPGFISPWAVDGLGAPFLLANEIIKNGGTLPGNQPQWSLNSDESASKMVPQHLKKSP